ncbi:metal-dependent phosphohydrolase [Methylobacterium sp. WL103]|uniref:metal-dependent phosphohydrolase n=1 Tax=unclassified Methylobacterium TaxID=2615210 RepID=UPI0011CA54C2|nr:MULTISPECIES: metal-dependent phosphohydrolase [unclassified Methylobacterium]TXM74607.1 metal-dependent phosphohydrolase [Methylobacterium sp. WL12]TXN03857.1 metal-dependent phosphohydrolase [Methylobacterium sp. WL103]
MTRPLLLRPLRRTASDAEAFARAVHDTQTDKAGDPYVTHLVRVVGRASAKLAGLPGILSGETVCELLQIAWLHDVIEDTPYDGDHLLAEGFSERVVHGVTTLSNLAETPYPDFIAGIVAHASLPAILVKLSDNEDNADPDRLAKLDAATRARLLAKYEPSTASLRAAARAKGWQDRGRA